MWLLYSIDCLWNCPVYHQQLLVNLSVFHRKLAGKNSTLHVSMDLVTWDSISVLKVLTILKENQKNDPKQTEPTSAVSSS